MPDYSDPHTADPIVSTPPPDRHGVTQISPRNTGTQDPAQFSPEEIEKRTLGQFYHSQDPIAGHIFNIMHGLGKQRG